MAVLVFGVTYLLVAVIYSLVLSLVKGRPVAQS